jgi:hemoglobin
MNDIRTRDDIELLVNAFYKKVVADPVISHFFTKVIQLSWEHHIPIMISFWETLLLDRVSYTGNPMMKHIALHSLSAIGHDHFERWIRLWEETVRENFSGAKAEEAVARAKVIAQIIESRIDPAASLQRSRE